jgi:hypothetical protein
MDEELALFGPLARVVEAERQRGNEVRLVTEERQLRGHRPYALCHHPMDRDAIEAEFELGRDFEWRPATAGPWMLMDLQTWMYVLDGSHRPGWRARRRRAAWWREWTEGSRPRRPLR